MSEDGIVICIVVSISYSYYLIIDSVVLSNSLLYSFDGVM